MYLINYTKECLIFAQLFKNLINPNGNIKIYGK